MKKKKKALKMDLSSCELVTGLCRVKDMNRESVLDWKCILVQGHCTTKGKQIRCLVPLENWLGEAWIWTWT
jgi:hypothetical protein